jgi:hypothetical protein
MANLGVTDLGVNTFFAGIIKQACEDALTGNLEAISWLSCYGVPLADHCELYGLSFHLRVFLRDVTQKIENGELKVDYSLKYNQDEIDYRKKQTDKSILASIEQIRTILRDNPQMPVSQLRQLTGRSDSFIRQHRSKLLAESAI